MDRNAQRRAAVSAGSADNQVDAAATGRAPQPVDLAAAITAIDLAYLAEVLVINQASRELRTIVSRYGRLEAGVRSYGATVELPMPVVGRYSLESVVVLFPPVDVVANHAGPTLNITA